MKFLTFFVIVLTSAHLASAIRIERSCPKDVKTIKNFDMKKYLDKWYEIKRYANNYQHGGACGATEFINNADGNYKFNFINIPEGKTNYENKTGYAVLSHPDDPSKPGKISISFSKNFKESNYWILDTDYTSFAVVWYCKDILDNVSEGLLINLIFFVFKLIFKKNFVFKYRVSLGYVKNS